MVEGRTPLAARLALALGATLLALLAADISLALAAPQLADTAWLAAHPPDAKLGRHRRPSADPALVYELKPDLDIRFGESVVRTDARGVRVPPQPAPAPPDALELVMLGDSTSFGWRVNYEQSFAALVAALAQAAWHRPVHVTNRSVPGYNSEQQLRVLEKDVLPDPPDLLIWHVDHNDANVALEPYQPVVLPPEAGDNALGSALLKAWRRGRMQRELELRLHEQQPSERLGGYVTSGPLWERHVAALERGAQATRAAGIPTLFVLFDCDVWFGKESQEHVARLHDPLLARLRAAGADVLDIYPLLQAHAGSQGWKNLEPLWLEAGDPHPSPEGHELLAGLIGGALHVRWPAGPERP
jgi:lysophospholipase L1-like esterase